MSDKKKMRYERLSIPAEDMAMNAERLSVPADGYAMHAERLSRPIQKPDRKGKSDLPKEVRLADIRAKYGKKRQHP